MTVRLGRVNITAPSSIQRSGDDGLSLALDTNQSATAAAGLVAMKQLKNMAGYYWEQFVPFIHGDASIAYMVQVTRAEVRDHAQSLAGGSYDLAVALSQVRYSRNARVSALITGQNRAGATGTPTPWLAIPLQTSGFGISGGEAIDAPGVTTGFGARTGPTVEGFPTGLDVFTDAAIANNTISYNLLPEDWYNGACWIYDAAFGIGGASSGSLVVGEQWDWPTLNWGLTNGLLLVERGDVLSGPINCALKLTAPLAATPTSWGTTPTQYDLQVEYPNGSGTYVSIGRDPASISVLQNSPQEAALRLVYDFRPVANQPIRIVVTLRLRRGARMVDLVMSATSGTYRFRIVPQTAMATSSGAHIVASSNDADGNRPGIWSNSTKTAGAVGTAKVTSSALTQYSTFSPGFVFNGAGSGVDTAANLDGQFNSIGAESISLVAP